MLERPQDYVGMTVVGPGAFPVGIVVDVGLAELGRPKFLLVKPGAKARSLVRVDIREVEGIEAGEIRLRMPLRAGELPA